MKKRTFVSILCLACSLLLSHSAFSAIVHKIKRKKTTVQTYAIKVVNADDVNIVYTGRIDFTDKKKPVFSSPGIYIRISFKGVACAVMFQDEFLNGHKNFYEAVVDGKDTIKISPVKGKTIYQLAQKLEDKGHEIIFVKRTESAFGKCTFLGFQVSGNLISPAPPKTRKLMFFGNSISVGSGNEAATNSAPCKDWNTSVEFSNANRSFCAFLSKGLNAEYHINGVSGIGAVRNYSSGDVLPMPAIYDRIHFADPRSQKWNFKSFVPDAIIIELGTNDFSPGDSPPGHPRPQMDTILFASAYIRFVVNLRTTYPAAKIFCISSPMLGDGWPDPSYHSATNLLKSLNIVSKHFKDDPQVKIVRAIKVAGKGCTTHPSVDEHENIARMLQKQVKKEMNW